MVRLSVRVIVSVSVSVRIRISVKIRINRGLHGLTFFGLAHPHMGTARLVSNPEKLSPARPSLCLVGPAWTGPARPNMAQSGPSSAYLKCYFTSGCSPGRKWGRAWNWNSSDEFRHNLHSCKLIAKCKYGKATSFYVDLNKLLLEDVWCILC